MVENHQHPTSINLIAITVTGRIPTQILAPPAAGNMFYFATGTSVGLLWKYNIWINMV